jgi:hypothetical protein
MAVNDDTQRGRAQKEREKAEALFKSASDSRKRYDWEWLTRDLFRRGYHFSRYSPNNKTVILQTRSTARIPINITYAQMRTIKNQVTSVRPKWEVFPRGLSSEAIQNARYSGKLLDYYYDHLNLRRLLKETIIQGLMYSVGGAWQIGYDPDLNNGEGDVFVWLIDPFDFYVDPSATSLNDAEFVVKAVRTSLNKVKANPNFKFYTSPLDLRGDSRMAASEYKQFLLQALKYYQPHTGSEEEEGAILKEAYIKVHVREDNQDELAEELRFYKQDAEDLRLGEVLMRQVTYLDSLQDPLVYKLTRRNYFPFAMYQADVNPMELYGESWIKHVIPMNRVLNALESSIFKYNYKYAVGRIVIDRNSGVRIFTNEQGDIVEKNAGAEVTSLPLQPLPSSHQQQIQNMRLYIEDVGGAHEVSMGRVPSGVKSGIGIAELKAADAVNQQDLIDGLEEFLIDVSGKILAEIAQNFDVPRVIRALGKGGDPEHFTIIGEDFAKNRSKRQVKIGTDTFDLAVIGADNEIKVSVGSWLSYTRGARLEMLKEWHNAGLIDQQTFLENAEFADVQGILDRTRKDQLLKKFMGTPNEQGVTDAEIAEQENYMMVNEGRTDVKPLEADNHQIHLAIHEEALGVGGNPLLEQHMRVHEAYIRAGTVTPARPEALAAPTPPAPEMGAPMGAEAMAPGGMAAPAAPPMAPPMGAAPPGQPPLPAPGSPEEAALMQSLMAVTGGQ